MSLAQLLTAHGDPAKVAAALGLSPAVATGTVAPHNPISPLAPVAGAAVYTAPAPTAAMPLNVDRPTDAGAAPVSGGGGAALSLMPASSPTLSANPPAWQVWFKAHALLLLGLLLVVLILAYAAKHGSKPQSGFRPSRMVKGSPEARAHMAGLRARKRGA